MRLKPIQAQLLSKSDGQFADNPSSSLHRMLKACKWKRVLIRKAANVDNQRRGSGAVGQKARQKPFEPFDAVRIPRTNVDEGCRRDRSLNQLNALFLDAGILPPPEAPPLIPKLIADAPFPVDC